MAPPTVLYLGGPDDAATLAAELGRATVLGTTDIDEAEQYLETIDIDLVAADPDHVGREGIAELVRRTTETRVVTPAGYGVGDGSIPETEWPGSLSEQLETPELRRQERAFTRSIFTDLPDIFYAFDEDGQLLRWSDRLEEVTGYAEDEVAEMHPVDLFEGEDVERVATAIDEVSETDETVTIEANLVTKDGTRIPYEFTGAQLQAADGTVLGVLGVGRDVSDRQEREEELLRYETVVETVSDGIYTTDPASRLTMVNDALVELTGYQREELLGQEIGELLADEHGITERIRQQLLEEPDQVVGEECDLETADGRIAPVEVRITALPAEDGIGGMAGVVRDVSERRAREHQLRALQRTTRELIVAEDEEAIAELAVEAAREIIGLPITAIWRYDDEADQLEVVAETAASEELFDGAPGFEPGESLAWEVFESGEFRVFEDVRSEPGRANPDTDLRTEIISPLGEHGVMATGTTEEGEFSERDTELFRILTASVEAALLRADRERQLRAREQELARQNKRLDEFASVLAHDIRNPLSVATGYLDLVREDGAPEDLDRIEEALERIDRLIDDLLMLARGGETVGETTAISLESAAESAWNHVETHDATLVTESAPTVQADRGPLQQALENLFRNAIEHGGPDVTVTVGPLDDGPGFYVANDGPGIPEADRESIFEYGFSGGEGTGIGLAIVRNVAEGHGWTVTATESESDGGARFEFRIE